MSDCMGTTVVFPAPLVALAACILATSGALPVPAEEKATEQTPPLAVDFLPAQLLTDAEPASDAAVLTLTPCSDDTPPAQHQSAQRLRAQLRNRRLL